MPFSSAQEAFDEFQRTGAYANSPKHFANEADWAEYKHMIPQQVKKDFRAKVAGNENRAIEGMQQGLTREQMGIFNRPEEGQALWRRLGMGLGTGLDMGRAYDWGGGTALNVGTSDLTKRNIERRGITDTERQRYGDFQAAGSPEAYWRSHRANQIQGLLSSGAIAKDAQGYYNPGPGGGDRYGANLEGYNLGQNPMGTGRGDPRNVGYTPQTVNPGYGGGYSGGGGGGYNSAGGGGYNPGLATYGHAPAAQPLAAAPRTGGPMYAPPTGGISGGQNFQVAPSTPGAAPQLSGGGGGMPAPAPLSMPQGGAPTAGKSDGGIIYERPPGQVGPFGAPGTGNPSGNSLFPAVPTPGSPGNPFDPAATPGGSGIVPGWRPEGNLPGVPVTASGLPPGMGGFQDFENTPYAGLLGQMGAGDLGIQDFNLMRAMAEYGGAQPYENYLGQRFGDVLGYDFQTGKPLTGQAADTANASSFGMLAPEVSRIMGDTDAISQRLRREVPEGGEKTAALGDLYRGAAGQVGGLRQNLANEAVQGVGNLMQMKKAFDPGAYTGGAEALLGAYGQGRGQDIGAYGQGLNALLQGRGQDVTWGLGQGNLGLGWAGLGQQGAQNAWQNYLQGRGQDIGLYGTTRGQDLERLSQQEAIKAQRSGQRSSMWGQLAGAAGTLLGGLLSDHRAKSNAQGFGDGLSSLGPSLWQASDATAKDDAAPYGPGLDAVKALKPYTYTYNDKIPSLDGVKATGFMAQDVKKVVPEAVQEAKLASGTLLSLQPMRLLATVVNAVKELDAKIDKSLASYGKKASRA